MNNNSFLHSPFIYRFLLYSHLLRSSGNSQRKRPEGQVDNENEYSPSPLSLRFTYSKRILGNQGLVGSTRTASHQWGFPLSASLTTALWPLFEPLRWQRDSTPWDWHKRKQDTLFEFLKCSPWEDRPDPNEPRIPQKKADFLFTQGRRPWEKGPSK